MNTRTSANSRAGNAGAESAETSCVLLPLRGHRLLVPNVVVAEILPYRRLLPRPDAPGWLLGMLSWRGQNLPVLAAELILDPNSPETPASPAGRANLVVMNRSRPLAGLSFYGLLVQELPRLVHAAAEDVSAAPDQPLPEATLMRVQLGTETALIPDLGRFEDLAQRALLP